MQQQALTPSEIVLHLRALRTGLVSRPITLVGDSSEYQKRSAEEAVHDTHATIEFLRELIRPVERFTQECDARTFLCGRCKQYLPKAKMMWAKPRETAHTCFAGVLRCDECVLQEDSCTCHRCGVSITWEGGSLPYVWLEIKSKAAIAWLTLTRVRIYVDVNTMTLREFKSLAVEFVPAPWQKYSLVHVDETLAENGVGNGDTVVVLNTGPV